MGLKFSVHYRNLSSSRRHSIEQAPLIVKNDTKSVDSTFVADLIDLFFNSLNKYVAASITRQLSDWAYQLLHGTCDQRIVLPYESNSFRDKPRVQTSRSLMVEGYLSIFWGDYKVTYFLYD